MNKEEYRKIKTSDHVPDRNICLTKNTNYEFMRLVPNCQVNLKIVNKIIFSSRLKVDWMFSPEIASLLAPPVSPCTGRGAWTCQCVWARCPPWRCSHSGCPWPCWGRAWRWSCTGLLTLSPPPRWSRCGRPQRESPERNNLRLKLSSMTQDIQIWWNINLNSDISTFEHNYKSLGVAEYNSEICNFDNFTILIYISSNSYYT